MKILFLDLENTIITPVIDGWRNVHLINVDKIRKIADSMRPDQLNIFSFAVHTEHDQKSFKMGLGPRIEQALGRAISFVPIVDTDIKNACCNARKIGIEAVDFSDMTTFWGKQDAFKLYVRSIYANTWSTWSQETDLAFLDDDVVDEDFTFPSLHITGKIRNIDNLEINLG